MWGNSNGREESIDDRPPLSGDDMGGPVPKLDLHLAGHDGSQGRCGRARGWGGREGAQTTREEVKFPLLTPTRGTKTTGSQTLRKRAPTSRTGRSAGVKDGAKGLAAKALAKHMGQSCPNPKSSECQPSQSTCCTCFGQHGAWCCCGVSCLFQMDPLHVDPSPSSLSATLRPPPSPPPFALLPLLRPPPSPPPSSLSSTLLPRPSPPPISLSSTSLSSILLPLPQPPAVANTSHPHFTCLVLMRSSLPLMGSSLLVLMGSFLPFAQHGSPFGRKWTRLTTRLRRRWLPQ